MNLKKVYHNGVNTWQAHFEALELYEIFDDIER